VILIGLGVIWLLNNLGMLEWSVWEVIFRLWPVLLVAVGLDLLLGRRSIWGSLLALVLTLAILAGVLWLFMVGMGTGGAFASEDVRQALDGATQAEVVIAPAVGTLHIEALSESANLIEGAICLGSGERTTPEFAVEGETATFTLRSEGVTFGPFIGSWDDQRGWDLGLNPDVPLQLEISLGVGQSDVDSAILILRHRPSRYHRGQLPQAAQS